MDLDPLFFTREQQGGQLFGHLVGLGDVGGADDDLVDRFALDAEQFSRIGDIDVAVPPAGAGDDPDDPADCEGDGVHGAVLVGRNDDDAVTDLEVHPLGHDIGNEDFTRIQRAGTGDTVFQKRHGGKLLLRLDTVEADVGGGLEVADHAAEFEAHGVVGNGRVGGDRLGDFFDRLGREVLVHGQVVEACDIPFFVDLEVAQHAVGDLANHVVFKAAGEGGEDQHEGDADGDQGGREQRAAHVASKGPVG